MSPRLGVGQVIRPPVAAAGGSFRGLAMRFAPEDESDFELSANSAAESIPFDDVTVDTDGFLLASDQFFGGYTVLTGNGGQVPSGLAGLYFISGFVSADTASAAAEADYLGAGIGINDTIDGPIGLTTFVPVPDESDGIAGVISFPPWAVVLAEGDVVSIFITNYADVSVFVRHRHAYMIMEYKGPAP